MAPARPSDQFINRGSLSVAPSHSHQQRFRRSCEYSSLETAIPRLFCTKTSSKKQILPWPKMRPDTPPFPYLDAPFD
ncbi:hypothetical protein G6O67_003102 [Ophiocordyceps sinensis]|uniref:Uncharacterized protein n=1 Tax=Ophiocordyceps sinensis TaxID=72228 RepID=A0A8H4V7X7_9HYPO|nr:hypothetical protein G6O67_003102 [Ophiocordyceps sinensis]